MAFSSQLYVHRDEIIIESEPHHDEPKCDFITDDDIIYDSNFIEETSSLIDPDHWHDNDLFVAAELGKTLLERNRKLEAHVLFLKGVVESQRSEIGLLRKQFNAFRDLNRNNVHLFEDVDRQCQKLEKKNQVLQAQQHAEKQRCNTLSELLTTLESSNEDLKRQLQDAHNNEQLLKLSFKNKFKLRKTVSVSNIQDSLNNDQYDASRKKNLSLHSRIDQLQQQCHMEHRLRINLETELQVEKERVVAQNERLQVLEAMLNEKCDSTSTHCCPSNKKRMELLDEVEHDQVQLHHTCHVGRLPTGGSVYSSRESLNKVGAGLLNESDFDVNNDDHNSTSISLLFELQNKYSEILEQYQALVENKSSMEQQETICTFSKDGKGLENKDFEARLDAIFDKESRTKRKQLVQDDYKPKYKDLFREAFSTLKEIKERRSI